MKPTKSSKVVTKKKRTVAKVDSGLNRTVVKTKTVETKAVKVHEVKGTLDDLLD